MPRLTEGNSVGLNLWCKRLNSHCSLKDKMYKLASTHLEAISCASQTYYVTFV
jgi:hypothetical protein